MIEDCKRVGDVGIWSAEKLDLLRCYLGGFLRATTKAYRRYYIDLFTTLISLQGQARTVFGEPVRSLTALHSLH